MNAVSNPSFSTASSGKKSFDINALRNDFPILQRHVHGKPLVYLDNAASAQKPLRVIEAIRDVYTNEYANVHRGLYYLSNMVTEKYERARESARAFINAPEARQVIFTRSATEAINLVASSYGALNIDSGDEIVLSIMEHHSNIVPWHFLRERQGAVLKWVPVSPEGDFLFDEFEKCLTPRTKLVAITHMSNVLGSIVPVKEVIACAHAHGVPVLIDGSQAAVHLKIDVVDLDADFYVFTGHKVYGPTGIGVLYGKMDLLDAMRPFNGGGEMIRSVTEDNVTYGDIPHRFEAGTPPIAQAIGLGVALDYVMCLDRDAALAHEVALTDYAHERLAGIDGMRFFGQAQQKSAIVSFNLAGIHAHDIASIIDREGVAIRAGTQCVQPLLTRYGLNTICRASFAMYNDFDEIDKLGVALEKASGFFS